MISIMLVLKLLHKSNNSILHNLKLEYTNINSLTKSLYSRVRSEITIIKIINNLTIYSFSLTLSTSEIIILKCYEVDLFFM